MKRRGRVLSKILGIALVCLMIGGMFGALPGIAQAQTVEIIIDTEEGETRFMTQPPQDPSTYYWIPVHDHDTFHTRAYNGNFWYTLCGEEGHGDPLYYGEWEASLPQSGQYEVFVWIPDPDPFAEHWEPYLEYTPTQYAVYQIYHEDGLTTKVVNQRLRTGSWYSLGTFNFDTVATVILNDRTGEPYCSTMIAFDAMKFVPVLCPIHLESRQDNAATSNKGTTTFAGSTHSLPKDMSVNQGSYTVTYSPEGGYEFVRWETSGNISVSNSNSQTTTVNVSCGGTLRAVYRVEEIHKPDLIVTSVSAPSSATVGEIISVSFTVENRGGALSGSFAYKIFLAVEPYIGTGASYQMGNTFTMGSLVAGESKPDTKDVTIPSVDPGDYYVAVYVDPYPGAIDEEDEDNNIGSTYPDMISIFAEEPPICAIELIECTAKPYIEPGMPLCWTAYSIGIGESFDIYVGGSTGDINEVRFSSDDSQDGNPTGEWTGWYGWNTSSGDWDAVNKNKAWSFATGGDKEVWAEIKDIAGQTSTCSANIVVLPLPEWFELPDEISLDDLQISKWILALFPSEKIPQTEYFPLFLQASLPDYDLKVNVVLISSRDPVTKYKLVRIKTTSVEDPRNLKLSVVLPSSLGGCVGAYVPMWLLDWVTNFEEKLVEEIPQKIMEKIVERVIGTPFPISFASSIADCATEGYKSQIQGWEIGEDFMVYLPIDIDLTIKAERGIDPSMLVTSPVVMWTTAPPPVRGTWEGEISKELDEIFLDIQEIPTLWAKIFPTPVEFRVYDSLGRVTGLVEGEIKEEISDSTYDEENKVVIIYSPTDSYQYEVAGVDEGTYGLIVASIENGETSTFTLTNVPTSAGAVHQYTIDWDDLSQGEKGVTVEIDSDGDGVFERIIKMGKEFDWEEKLSSTYLGLRIWGWLIVAGLVVFVILVSIINHRLARG